MGGAKRVMRKEKTRGKEEMRKNGVKNEAWIIITNVSRERLV